MSDYVRPELAGLAPYTPGEQPQEPGFVKLNTNENPYPPSPRVIGAVREATSAVVRLYPDPSANGVRTRAAARYGVDPAGVLVGNGSDELLSLIFRAYVGPGDRICFPSPTYSLYETLAAIVEGAVDAVPYPDDFAFPATVIGRDARLTLLCHPNSPSGLPVPLDAVREVASAAKGVVVADEAYVDFGAESAVGLVAEFDNLFVLRTFSKSFSLAGMRLGLAIAQPSLMADLGAIKDSYNVNRLSLAAAEAALDDYPWMEANVRRVIATRERLRNALLARSFVVPDSRTNFLLARRPGENLEALHLGLKQRKILIRYFATERLADSLRITIGTDDEVDALLRALDEIL